MELFCALLTGLFAWVFLFHFSFQWRRSALARAHEAAGALLIEAKVARGRAQMGRLRSSVFMLALFLWMACLQCWRMSSPRTLCDDFIIGCFFFNVLAVAFPSFRRDAPLELCEHGVIGWLKFTPWSKLSGCRWRDARPIYTISQILYFERDVHTPEEVAAITAVAGRFVPVYDVEGNLIAEPTPAERAVAASLPPRSSGWRFQFGLQSLLLLMVVASCMSSCYGIHYRRIQPQEEAVAKLEMFHPNVSHSGDEIDTLDFKACKAKPGDNDLIYLEGLRSLKYLYLDGSPITDAGLKHLYPIKTLTSVSLSNTKVTQKGVDDLKRQLPNANIFWYPPSRAPVVAPRPNGQ